MTKPTEPGTPQPSLLDDEAFAATMQRAYAQQEAGASPQPENWSRIRAKTLRRNTQLYPAIAIAAMLVLAVGIWRQVEVKEPTERIKAGADAAKTMPSELTLIDSDGHAVLDDATLSFGKTIHASLAANTDGFAMVFAQSPAVAGSILWQGRVSIKRQVLLQEPSHEVIGVPLMESGVYRFCSLAAPSLEDLAALKQDLGNLMQKPDIQAALSCLQLKVVGPH